MERARFEVPKRSGWPVALFAGAMLVGAAVGVWYWRAPAGAGGRADRPAGADLLEAARDESPAAAPSSAPTPADSGTAANAEAGRDDPAPARVADLPAPAAEVPLATLLDNADAAFDAGDWRTSLDAYKLAAVRLQAEVQAAADEAGRREFANQLAAVQERVSEAQRQSGALAAGDRPTLANRTPHAPPAAGEVREVKIKDLGNFPYDDEVGGVPADVAALDGMGIRLVGYMVPTYQTDQIREFTLVPDVYECCFGNPPGVEHTIQVKLPAGKAVMFTYGEISVSGTLRVSEERRDGFVMNLFTVEDVTSVRATGRG